MVAHHIHDALRQIHELRRRVLESRRFTGYSGRARAYGGLGILPAMAVWHLCGRPDEERSMAVLWLGVALWGVAWNYGALAAWYLAGARRGNRTLLPAIDPLVPLGVGGLLTLGMLLRGDTAYLYPIWMMLFGLTNLASRWVLAREIWPLGLYFIACGAMVLFLEVPFTNPWPMATVFLIGELWGGYIFHRQREPRATPRRFAEHCLGLRPYARMSD